MEECMEKLAAIQPNDGSGRHNDRSTGRDTSRHPIRLFSSVFLTLFFLALAYFLWQAGQTSAAAASGGAALFSGIRILLRFAKRKEAFTDTDEKEGCGADWDDEDAFSEEEEPEDYDSNKDSEESADDRLSPAARRLRLLMQSLQKRYQEVSRREWEQECLLEKAQNIEEELEALTRQEAAEEDIRLEIQAINLAQSTLQRISGELRDSFGPHLNSTMSRILSGLTGGVYTEVYADSQLNVTVRTGLRTVPLDSLSRGTIEQIHLAMRLAVIDLLFPQGGMPLLLDDCFLTYDDGRLTQTLNWAAENYSGQVFIFTCQKREAALLQQEQIPFTFIPL